MSLDAFNYTKGALLYAFCYGVYVKQLCSPFSISIIFYCQYDIWDNFYHPPLEAFFACSCIVELNWISPNKTSSARRRLSGSFCNIDITS